MSLLVFYGIYMDLNVFHGFRTNFIGFIWIYIDFDGFTRFRKARYQRDWRCLQHPWCPSTTEERRFGGELLGRRRGAVDSGKHASSGIGGLEDPGSYLRTKWVNYSGSGRGGGVGFTGALGSRMTFRMLQKHRACRQIRGKSIQKRTTLAKSKNTTLENHSKTYNCSKIPGNVVENSLKIFRRQPWESKWHSWGHSGAQGVLKCTQGFPKWPQGTPTKLPRHFKGCPGAA